MILEMPVLTPTSPRITSIPVNKIHNTIIAVSGPCIADIAAFTVAVIPFVNGCWIV
jgi:hypothetical protein